MNVLVFINNLGIGGTEKAACHWACGLKQRGHSVAVLTMQDGPRRFELEANGISVFIKPMQVLQIAEAIALINPDVIHVHAPGFPHEGDLLGEALLRLPKIPVVQTNIFGRLENPKENAWTDYRLFISWTSCVQAARRSFQKLDSTFFENKSVAVYPLDPDDGPDADEIKFFRKEHGLLDSDIVFGRISRPEPNKWTDLPLQAFRLALKQNPHLKLLLREPPPAVTASLLKSKDAERFCILSATNDPSELRLTIASLDAVLHTSSIGESFGYGIAEPMNYGKPVITNSIPWGDQAQIELVRHGECGLVASTPQTMKKAILDVASDFELRASMGEKAKSHIRYLTHPKESLDRLEGILNAAIERALNPKIEEDLKRAQESGYYLDKFQFGKDWQEQLVLRSFYFRVRFHQLRKIIKTMFKLSPEI